MVSTCTALIPTYYRRYIDPEICQSTWPYSTRLFLLTKSQKIKKKKKKLVPFSPRIYNNNKRKEKKEEEKTTSKSESSK